MRKFLLSIFIFLAAFLPGMASHIVGGEFEISYRRGMVYQVLLKMYVDEINSQGGVIDGERFAQVGIYQKGTNKHMTTVTLERMRAQDRRIDYGQNCAVTDKVSTMLLKFYGNVDLTGYTHPAGYYMAWQNCCRNAVIKNIQDPGSEGMAFYLEFPPITTRNNSPIFPQLKGDFPCLKKPFTFDFSGNDPNGDSLVYSLETPLAGSSTTTSVPPSEGPYAKVIWTPGYGITNQIPGNPAFTIDPRTGEISFTPTELGLFVFSVKIEEYRNGVKIGMVQRDFQFPVISCPSNAPASVDLAFGDGSLYDVTKDTLFLEIGKDTCFSLQVSDSNTILFNQSETLSLSVLKNTLPPGIIGYTSKVTVTPATDTVSSNLCFNACNRLFLQRDSVFYLSFQVTDAPKCPTGIAHYDTLNLVVVYKPQQNQKPIIGTVPPVSTIYATVNKPIIFDVYAEDADLKDIITLTGNGDGFSFEEKGMVFSNASGSDSIGSQFRWTPTCDDLKNQEEFLLVRFSIKDNSCIPNNQEPKVVKIILQDTATTITSILPHNLITPNNDHMNDEFYIPDLPQGNCEYFFQKVTVFNRWGSKVFESSRPDFKWNGEKAPPGLYFYNVDLNKKTVKGWIELVR